MQLKAVFVTEMVTMCIDDSFTCFWAATYLVNKRWNEMNLISLLTKTSVNNNFWKSK